MKRKTLLRALLQRQLNKNNKGASLVTVLLVASIVAILVTAVLAVVILNVYMKKADMEGQDNFYDAESALEEIRAGLAVEESKATTAAYLDTLLNYGSFEDEAAKTNNFNEKFSDYLKDSLVDKNNKYRVSTLESYFKEDLKKNGTAEVVTFQGDDKSEGVNAFNVTELGAELKNVQVRYTNKDGYVSEIKTDILLEYPAINFQNATTTDNILTYGLIANSHFVPGGNNTIVGNAYIGGDKSKPDEPAADIQTANDVSFMANENQETNVICGGNVRLKNSDRFNANNVALWADRLVVENSDYNMNSGNTYIKDDIVLGNSGKANMSGKLIMFGNPWVAISEQMVEVPEIRNEAKSDMPSYSSSILVTGSGAGIDMSGLKTMVIGGSAYLDTLNFNDSIKNKSRVTENGRVIRRHTNTDVYENEMQTGQSVMLKSDQRAYLVPSTLVGAGLKNDGSNYKNGLTNPMTSSQYEALKKEIMAEKGYSDETQIQAKDWVNFELAEPTIGVSLNNFVRAHGVTDERYMPGIKMRAYPTTNGGSMMYFFIEFYTVGNNFEGEQNSTYIPAEAFYNNWYKLYHTTYDNYTRLLGNIDYYTPYGIKLPKDVNDKTRMYFTGNILSTETNPVIIPDIITQPDFTIDLNEEYSNQSAWYQEAYYTLNKNLSTDPKTLTGTMKNHDLFDNIITTTATVDGETYLMPNKEFYVSESGETAVVCKGNYTYRNAEENSAKLEKDNAGNTHVDAKINCIIATGDVTVEKDFNGMIIAGGDIKVKDGCKITADADKASKAIVATKYNEGLYSAKCAANFVVDASRYLLGGTGRTEGDSGAITMKDYVTYRNWTRV